MIFLNHHKASPKNEGTIKLGATQYGKKEVAAVVNNKINNKFQTRLAYNKQMSDGPNTKSGNDHWGETNKDHFTTDLIYQLEANEELRLNMKLLRNHVGGNNALTGIALATLFVSGLTLYRRRRKKNFYI